jgi:hypothetical protein
MTPAARVLKAICGARLIHTRHRFKVSLAELVFDWESGDARDGVDVRINRTTDVLKPEWLPGTRNEPVAWIRSTRPRARARFRVQPSTITRLAITAQANAPWLGFEERVVPFVLGISWPDTISFRLAGSTPATVSSDAPAFSWLSSRPNGLASEPVVFDTSGPHPVYTLLATPRLPMVEPWTEVLFYACDFARGSSTEPEVVRNIVTNVYWNSNLIYNPSYSYSYAYHMMDLTSFLADVASQPFVYLDCRDCSHWTHIQSNALGLSGKYNTIGESFPTNYVLDGHLSIGTRGTSILNRGLVWDTGGSGGCSIGWGRQLSAPPHTLLLNVERDDDAAISGRVFGSWLGCTPSRWICSSF